MRLILLVSLIFLTACGTLTFDPSTPPTTHEIAERSKFYRHDLKVKVNSQTFVGVGVAKRAASYEITVQAEKSIDRIIWRSCGRQEVVDKEQRGWFSDLFGGHSDSYTFKYTPMAELEDRGACPLKIEVFTAKKSKVGFARIEFEEARPEYNVLSVLKCNGRQLTRTGVGICQTAAGIEQEFRFDRPVILATPTKDCAAMKSVDPNRQVYRLGMPQGECLYNFGAEDGSWFRLITFGYNEVPFRE